MRYETDEENQYTEEMPTPLKPYRVRVWCMSASYLGKIMATSARDAELRVRASYAARGDDRAGWTVSVRPWEASDEPQSEDLG